MSWGNDKGRCKTCKYYDAVHNICRKYPPIYIKTFQGGQFPTVSQMDWCGEYKKDTYHDGK